MKIKEIKISIDIFALINYWIKLRKRKIRTVNGHKFALKPDKPDRRDIKYQIRLFKTLPPTANMDMIKDNTFIYDQLELGSCTANMGLGTYRRTLKHDAQPDFEGSRLELYYNTRTDKTEDTGASIRDTFKAMNKYGLCSEKNWPYFVNKFAVKPPETCYQEGLNHQTILFKSIDKGDINAIKDAIACGNFGGFGIPVYESFESAEAAKTGIIPMPNRCKEKLYGYHAVAWGAYDEKYLWCANSWGPGWGHKGYFALPWSFVKKYASDIWVLYSVE